MHTCHHFSHVFVSLAVCHLIKALLERDWVTLLVFHYLFRASVNLLLFEKVEKISWGLFVFVLFCFVFFFNPCTRLVLWDVLGGSGVKKGRYLSMDFCTQ